MGERALKREMGEQVENNLRLVADKASCANEKCAQATGQQAFVFREIPSFFLYGWSNKLEDEFVEGF